MCRSRAYLGWDTRGLRTGLGPHARGDCVLLQPLDVAVEEHVVRTLVVPQPVALMPGSMGHDGACWLTTHGLSQANRLGRLDEEGSFRRLRPS